MGGAAQVPVAEHDPIEPIARALEDLLRAGADAVAQWRHGDTRLLDRGRETLATALRAEVARWERRAAGDPAAARVRDLFAAALDLLDEPQPPGPRPPGSRPTGRREVLR